MVSDSQAIVTSRPTSIQFPLLVDSSATLPLASTSAAVQTADSDINPSNPENVFDEIFY